MDQRKKPDTDETRALAPKTPNEKSTTDDDWVDLHDGWEPVRRRRNSEPNAVR
ncbi:MAG: hypothetical protein AAGF12_40670 [Myxococcota bacterium]